MSKRKPIGRTLDTKSLLNATSEQTKREQTFVLSSGSKASFVLTRIEADKLETSTFVDTATNGRDQKALTEASVSDIARTLSLQQFFPAIGCKRTDGRIEILDGSRRRAAAIFIGTGLDVLVTESNINFEDARQLAADIQTAREHNLREIGLRLLALRDNGMNQKEIAENQNMSQAKVTRAIQAASVPEEMLSIFPVQSELTYPDYKVLLELSNTFSGQSLDVATLIETVASTKEQIDSNLPSDQYKDALLKAYKAAATQQQSSPKKAPSKTEKLWSFNNKDTFARRKEKERTVSYEFGRLPKNLIKDIDKAIAELLKQHLDK